MKCEMKHTVTEHQGGHLTACLYGFFLFFSWYMYTQLSCFAVAFIVFTLTVEPTASFWDAGEYIATSAKLQVGHPPGAPLFQMLGAFFAMFTSEVSEIAKMVNFW